MYTFQNNNKENKNVEASTWERRKLEDLCTKSLQDSYNIQIMLERRNRKEKENFYKKKRGMSSKLSIKSITDKKNTEHKVKIEIHIQGKERDKARDGARTKVNSDQNI